MRTSTFLLTTLAAVATAQIDPALIAQIPDCASTGLISGITSSGCSLTDSNCICSNAGLRQTLTDSVKSACSSDDQARTLALFGKICPEQASAAATSAEAAASTANSVAEAATGTDGILTDTARLPVATGMATGSATGTGNLTATTGSYTAPATPSMTAQENGASKARFGLLAAGIVGVAVLFAGF